MKIPQRFIIVDDDSITNLLCKIIIEEAAGKNSDIKFFSVPQKALEYIESEYRVFPVSTLMLLDINMPHLSGWDVLEELMSSAILINDFITIYMLSSSVDPRDRQRAEAHKLVSGFLEKPLSGKMIEEICEIK